MPADWGTDGVSFASEIKGGEKSLRDLIYCWYERDGKRDKASQHTRNQWYKLYADGKFYNVVEDFEEKNPIDVASLDEETRSVYLRLKQELDQRVEQTASVDERQQSKAQALSRGSQKRQKELQEAKKKE